MAEEGPLASVRIRYVFVQNAALASRDVREADAHILWHDARY